MANMNTEIYRAHYIYTIIKYMFLLMIPASFLQQLHLLPPSHPEKKWASTYAAIKLVWFT